MKKRKKSQNASSSKGVNQKTSLSKRELEKLKKDYKEGKLKFNSSDIADAIISQYKTL